MRDWCTNYRRGRDDIHEKRKIINYQELNISKGRLYVEDMHIVEKSPQKPAQWSRANYDVIDETCLQP